MATFWIIGWIISTSYTGLEGQVPMSYNMLTPEEERIIVHKGTEAPFTGKYLNHHEAGTYSCKRCSAPLYRSSDKFDSHCGWPSFDDEIPGAVKRVPDADGRRTEIVCNTCQAHLGHVFLGEGLTEKNTRHCVNSISLNFISLEVKNQMERAIFAGGCFWGMEYFFQKAPGVISVTSGYIGGSIDHPTYQQVCRHETGHAEAIEVIYDQSLTTYEDLARLFFEIHDPTQINRQGPDIGHQYRSEIFYINNDQKLTAEKLIQILKAKGYHIVTQVTPATAFWKAEEYHQDYYETKGGMPYCHGYTRRF